MFKILTVNQTLEISLRFMYQMKDEVKSQLNGRLLKYYDTFQGYFFAHENLKLLSKNQPLRVYTSTPCVYVNIEYNALVFRPEKMTKLRGEVTSYSDEHVFVKIFGFIEGSVERGKVDNSMDEEEKEEKTRLEYSVGDVVSFKFLKFFRKSEIDRRMCISGIIDSDSEIFSKDKSENFSVVSFQSAKSFNKLEDVETLD